MSKPMNKDVNVTTTTNLLSLTYSLSADMSKPIAVIKNMFKHINLGDHEDNDDVPLLFSPISESDSESEENSGSGILKRSMSISNSSFCEQKLR